MDDSRVQDFVNGKRTSETERRLAIESSQREVMGRQPYLLACDVVRGSSAMMIHRSCLMLGIFKQSAAAS